MNFSFDNLTGILSIKLLLNTKRDRSLASCFNLKKVHLFQVLEYILKNMHLYIFQNQNNTHIDGKIIKFESKILSC